LRFAPTSPALIHKVNYAKLTASCKRKHSLI
jgi:hypothetical protein